MLNRHSMPLPVVFHSIFLDQSLPLVAEQVMVSDRPLTHLHRHDILEFGLCHTGEGEFFVADKRLPFAPGDFCVLTPSEPHRARSRPGGSRWTFVYLDPRRLVPGDPSTSTTDLHGPGFANIISRGKDPDLSVLMRLLIAEASRSDPLRESAIRGLVIVILSRLHRCTGRASGHGMLRRTARIAGALRLISRGYRRDLTVEALARDSGLSPSGLRRAFIDRFGVSPRTYVINYRLHRAALALREGRPVTAAALQAGFTSLSSFHRHFRKVFGCAPRTWRDA